MTGNTQAALEIYDRVRSKAGWFLLVGIVSVPVVTVAFRELGKPGLELRTGVTTIDEETAETSLDADFGIGIEREANSPTGRQHEGPQGPSIDSSDVIPDQRATVVGTTAQQPSKKASDSTSSGSQSTVPKLQSTTTDLFPETTEEVTTTTMLGSQTTKAKPSTTKPSPQTTKVKPSTTKAKPQTTPTTKPRSTKPVSTANQVPDVTTPETSDGGGEIDD